MCEYSSCVLFVLMRQYKCEKNQSEAKTRVSFSFCCLFKNISFIYSFLYSFLFLYFFISFSLGKKFRFLFSCLHPVLFPSRYLLSLTLFGARADQTEM